MRIGKNVIVSDNVNEQYYQSYNSPPEDCFIVSGTTFKTKQFIENTYHNKVKSIFITSMRESTWKEKVDVILQMTTIEKLYSHIAPEKRPNLVVFMLLNK